ncbi:MAG: hypothetical protein HYT90_05300 [Candidatus Omnitrophica bacterium]|nr:hypothetical protein [Candidatus Omnitrophota bacterium]
MSRNKYGARVFLMGEDVVVVKQTVKSGSGYTADYRVKDPYKDQRLVKLNDDAGIATAIRDALSGNLKK